jgi:hypothetical protein
MNTELANLRRACIRCHKKLRQTETLVADYRAKLAEIEAAIYAIAPELKLPLLHRQYSQVFKRGEYTRIALDVLRQAGEPLPLREIALRALAAKGVALPDYRLRKLTRLRLANALVVFQERGVVEKVGSPNKW